ncbi:amidohydrolase family protein [Pseudokineococcus marinus]|uniref:Amidohydrolase family protein n=1 Tax=Pseudokineococcus marinus TaxID=351215 RepID=A0A849BMR7_9ACTN|nr:amidohydrolase family protein [Pseudokineococcus marinus]NNH22643.1 amidohydrolase family protein [Pseudokineococcus marinus]
MSAYDGPVVDAHHHVWQPRLGRQPWLRPGAAIPFRYGDYEALKRDYMPDDLRADAEDAGVRLVGSVTMETEWEEDDPLGEMDWTAAVAAREGLPTAGVAHAVLDASGVDAVLGALADRPFVRGVRHKPGQAPSPARAAAEPTLMTSPVWRRGYARLAEHGLPFELQTAWWHLDEAVDLVRAHPGTPVVLNHAGLPADRSEEGLAGWEAALRRLAALEQVLVKISGIGRTDAPWTAEGNRRVVETCVDAFGPERTMLASNFPVDSLTATYAEVWGGFREITSGWSRDEQLDVFARTAVRHYRLPPALVDAGAPVRAEPPLGSG